MNHTHRRYRRRKPLCAINIVPYINLSFVLLIIFMMTAPLQQVAVDVNLPVIRDAIIQKKQYRVIISIPQNGQLYLSDTEYLDKPLTVNELVSQAVKLQKNNPQMQIVIKADQAVAYGKVILVMAALKKAGVSQVGLLASSLGS